MKRIITITLFLLSLVSGVRAQLQSIPYGDFETWAVHYIKESKVVGGQTRAIYIPAPKDTLWENKPYIYKDADDPWATSNDYINFMGIYKTSTSVEPDKRGHGTAAKLSILQEDITVIGLDMHVILAGTLYVGRTREPFNATGNYNANVDFGWPYEGTPKALVFDYKSVISPDSSVTQCAGFSKPKTIHHIFDHAHAYCYLQRRWEDNLGNIHAERVATAYMKIDYTTDWVNGHVLTLHYGEIVNPNTIEQLQRTWMFARNSSGRMVRVREEGWATPGTKPTHICISFSASGLEQGGAGHVGNALWVDNVCLKY